MRAQHIALAGAAQLHLDPAHAIDGVGGHPRERHAGGQSALDHLRGISGLVTKRMLSGTWAAVRRSGLLVQSCGR